jgi:hypothetical protein
MMLHLNSFPVKIHGTNSSSVFKSVSFPSKVQRACPDFHARIVSPASNIPPSKLISSRPALSVPTHVPSFKSQLHLPTPFPVNVPCKRPSPKSSPGSQDPRLRIPIQDFPCSQSNVLCPSAVPCKEGVYIFITSPRSEFYYQSKTGVSRSKSQGPFPDVPRSEFSAFQGALQCCEFQFP